MQECCWLDFGTLLSRFSSARNSPAVDRAPHRPHTDSRHGSREASREASRKESSDTRDRHRHRSRSNERRRRSKSRERHRHRRSRSRDRGSRKHRSRSHERRRHRSRSPTHHKKRESSFERDLRREQERVRREKHWGTDGRFRSIPCTVCVCLLPGISVRVSCVLFPLKACRTVVSLSLWLENVPHVVNGESQQWSRVGSFLMSQDWVALFQFEVYLHLGSYVCRL